MKEIIKMNKLYKIKVRISDYYVIGTDPTNAQDKLLSYFDKGNMRSFGENDIISIKMLACENDGNIAFLSNYYLIT